MVHYNPAFSLAQLPPIVCPKCGSHRTQIVGRSEKGDTIVLRCNSCGERSRISVPADSKSALRAAGDVDTSASL